MNNVTKSYLKAALLAAALCALLLLPQILYSIQRGETHHRGYFQDPDDYTQVLTALEAWEENTWWNKRTAKDGTPETGETRPDHWSQIHRTWLVAGAAIHQKITGSSNRESLTAWAFWSNAPLLILCAAALGACLKNERHLSPWTPAMLASFILFLPTTRWAGNLGHPDHHLWIIAGVACAGACLLTQKYKIAGVALGFTYSLSPLTFLPMALGICVASIAKPSAEAKVLLKWTASAALILWLAEYWKTPQLTRLDAPNPWVPLMLLAIPLSNFLRPSSKSQWVMATGAICSGILLASLSILNPENHLTILSTQWRKFSVHEGIHSPTNWLDPIYFLVAIPLLLVFLLPSWRKQIPKHEMMLGASIGSVLAAIRKLRAHEGAGTLCPTWLVLSKEKTLGRVLPPCLVVLCFIATSLDPPPHMQDFRKVTGEIPPGSRTLSSPVYHPAITWISGNPSPISHHWECWPQNLPIYEWLEEPDPAKFITKARNLGATHILAGTKLNGIPLNQKDGEPTPIHLLALGVEIPETQQIASQGEIYLYRILSR